MHLAYCMWHTSVLRYEETWRIPDHSHIRGTIRSSPDGVLIADELLRGRGFMARRDGADNNGPGKRNGYYVQLIGLVRI